MAAQKHYEEPGSPEWNARRARCWNAGDAPAMLGCSTLQTRTELLHQVHTGLQREFSEFVQEKVIDRGHRIEALCRPLAEDILGEELTVLAYSLQVAGLGRPLGASLDGITFLEDTTWECKSINDALRAALPHAGRDSHAKNDGRQLPKMYRVQKEQQLLVTGAKRALFSAASINADGSVAEERHAWYYPDPELRAEIIAGWKQFEADLAAYVPPVAVASPPAGRAPEALPALRIEVTGMVTASNLDTFKEQALAVFRSINRELTTDADFADAEKTVKWCGDVEDRLKAAKQHALSQTESIDALFRAIDDISAEARTVRLSLDKLVKAEKERRRGEIVAGGISALKAHIEKLNERLGRPYMPQVQADFGGCIKGLKSLASMEDKVSTELARAKIAANEIADRIELNLRHLREHAEDFKHLFPDTASIVQKSPEDLQALVTARIAEHRAAEERRAAELAERERARIRQEEEARARAQAQREQQERDAAERRQREEAEAAQRRQEQEAAARELQTARANPAGAELSPAAQTLNEQEGAARFAAAHPRTVVPLPTRAPAAQTQPTLKLGDVNRHLAPFSITAEGLRQLGFEPAGRERAAVLYHDGDLPYILTAAIQHLTKAREQIAKAA